MKRVGIVSYNLHYNYSNYGSILQTYALQRVIRNELMIEPIVIDYCPDSFKNSNPSNPLEFIEDKESDFYNTCKFLLNDIRENEDKMRGFVGKYYHLSSKTYYSENFQDSLRNESLDGYVCGSDAIWSFEYFKTLDDAFYGNYDCMRNSHTVSYAASFGETSFSDSLRAEMLKRMANFKAIGVREQVEIENIRKSTSVPVKRVLDPTFLVPQEAYRDIMTPREIQEPYLLIYSRRYDPKLYESAEAISRKYGLKIVEISLDIRNAEKNILRYSAGVEEFLSLIYNSSYVITNSLHGTIFSIIMNKDFYVFPRLHGEIKIAELLSLLQISERKLSNSVTSDEISPIDYNRVNGILSKEILSSMDFLRESLEVSNR